MIGVFQTELPPLKKINIDFLALEEINEEIRQAHAERTDEELKEPMEQGRLLAISTRK